MQREECSSPSLHLQIMLDPRFSPSWFHVPPPVLTFLLSPIPFQVHLQRERLFGPFNQMRPVLPTLSSPNLLLYPTACPECLVPSSHLRCICLERDGLVPPVPQTRSSPSCLWVSIIGLTSMLSLTPSQVCWLREGLSVPSYQTQPVSPPRSSPSWFCIAPDLPSISGCSLCCLCRETLWLFLFKAAIVPPRYSLKMLLQPTTPRDLTLVSLPSPLSKRSILVPSVKHSQCHL